MPLPLCRVAVEVTGLTGAGIMLMSDELSHGTLCASDAISALIEQVQYTLGEGPCIDAHRYARPVLEPELSDRGQARWLGFTSPVVEAGAHAVFAFPLRVGAIRIGVLDLYRDRPGLLTDDQHADSLVMANIATEMILLLQADAPAATVAAELEAGADFHPIVHQASGMVAAQLGVGVGQALVRLRARAFATGRSVHSVARDVVSRRLRFDDARDDPDDPTTRRRRPRP